MNANLRTLTTDELDLISGGVVSRGGNGGCIPKGPKGPKWPTDTWPPIGPGGTGPTMPIPPNGPIFAA
jgi:hypothetical protein